MGGLEALSEQTRIYPDRAQVRWSMTGIDTIILLRLWHNDDPVQTKRIDALLAEHGRMAGSLLVKDDV